MALHPWKLLERELRHRGRTQKEFADLIEKTQVEVNYIIKGKRNINADWALRIWTALGTSKEFWLNLQTTYELREQENNSVLKDLTTRISQRVIKLSPEAAFA